MVLPIARDKVTTYDPGSYFILVGATPIWDFENVRVTKGGAKWRFHRGTRGEKSRSMVGRHFDEVSITINRTSFLNDALMAQFAILRNLPLSEDLVPIVIKEAVFPNLSLHVMLEATLEKYPDSGYSREVDDLLWVFKGELNIDYAGGDLSN